LRRVLAEFPVRHIVYCFAYGSGALRQAGRRAAAAAGESPMVDLMFVVDDTVGFHRANLAANPGHYSAIGRLGPVAVAAVQTSAYGGRVYFNTLVEMAGRTFKYGVIDAADFRLDLRTWRALYVAGRLHKPVLKLRDTGGLAADDLVARNLESAAHAALLQLPGTFAEDDLYRTIVGLSYGGDFRMIVGEDKRKVANIVRPQTERFRALYGPALRLMADRVSDASAAAATMDQDKSAGGALYHLERLPEHLRNVLLRSVDNGHADDQLLRTLAGRPDLGDIVRDGIRRIVFYSSLAQSLKGVPMAGLRKSVVYSYNKLRKMVNSMLPY